MQSCSNSLSVEVPNETVADHGTMSTEGVSSSASVENCVLGYQINLFDTFNGNSIFVMRWYHRVVHVVEVLVAVPHPNQPQYRLLSALCARKG